MDCRGLRGVEKEEQDDQDDLKVRVGETERLLNGLSEVAECES